jgi:hypothetical protein
VHELALDSPMVPLVQGVRPQIVEVSIVPEQAVDDHQEGAPDGVGHSSLAPPGGQALVLGREVGASGSVGGLGRLDEEVPQSRTPFAVVPHRLHGGDEFRALDYR